MKRQRTFQMVLSAMFIAMIILQSFVPFLGNIPLVVLNITIIHITVIVGGIVLGPQACFTSRAASRIYVGILFVPTCFYVRECS